MKSIIKITIFAFVLITSSLTYSQSDNDVDLLITNSSNNITTFDSRSKKIVGSSYINESFSPAKINDKNEIYAIRYNALQDKMEIDKSGSIYNLNTNLISSITFNTINKTYKVYTYEDITNNKQKGFFVVLFSGSKLSLLLQEKIKYIEERIAKNGYEDYTPPTLKRVNDMLFFADENGIVKELSNRKKDVLAIFSSKENEIELYIKENKLNYKKEKDLITIFSYYNSLF